MNWIKQQVANVTGSQEPIYGPSAIKSVAAQTEQCPWTEIDRQDLQWLAMNSTCVETQTFYLMAETGHIGMVQIIYNNVAGIHTTFQFNTKIFYPNRSQPALWSSDTLENAEFSEDRTSIHANGCAVTLNDNADSYTIKSVVNDNSVVNLVFSRHSPGVKAGKDGKTLFGNDFEHPWGTMKHVFWPRSKASGSIITQDGEIDFSGRGTFIHALQGMKPHHAAARWNFVNFQSSTYSAIMMEFTTPPSYGSTRVNVGVVVCNDRIIYAGSNNEAIHVSVRHDADNGWPEPEAIKIIWNEQNPHQQNESEPVKAILQGQLGHRLDRVDVMAKVPNIIKTIVGGAVGTKPYIYQYSPQSRLSLEIQRGNNKVSEEGELFSEATFIS